MSCTYGNSRKVQRTNRGSFRAYRKELEDAVKGGADYVGIGPIYETKSKSDAKAPAGLTFLRQARSLLPDFPIVAIGGITPENAHETLLGGADGVAIISAICQCQDRQETVRACKAPNLL